MRRGAIIGRGTALAVVGILMTGVAVLAQSLERKSPSESQAQSPQTSTVPQPRASTPPAQGAPSFTPPPGALVAPGETPQLTLLYTGNVVGYLDPCG
jgi:hypothetical protein